MKNKFVKHFETNTEGRDFIVGDLHGCYEDFLLALKGVNFNEKVDRVFSVGDLIDRGPNSYECIQLLDKPWFHAVQGNHEDMMVLSVLHNSEQAMRIWMSNGGQWIYKTGTWELKYTQKQLEKMAHKLAALPIVITVGRGKNRYNIVHAEFKPSSDSESINDQSISNWKFTDGELYSMLWGRGLLNKTPPSADYNPHEGLSPTFVGHSPVRKVVRSYQQMYIDTGCVYHHTFKSEGRSLTLACPQDKALYQYSPEWKKVTKIPFSDVNITFGKQ